MSIQSKFNKIKQSQVKPGFAAFDVRSISLWAALVILAFSFIGLSNNPEKFILSMPQAEASASLKSGVEEFSASQKIYMVRALQANHDNIVKMQGASLKAVLSEPELVRADLPTVVWQYRSKKCVLDIYFKADQENVDLENVIHYEMRHRDYRASQNDFAGQEAACVRSLLPSVTAPRMLSVSSIYKSYIQ